jgi:hypothetical protein
MKTNRKWLWIGGAAAVVAAALAFGVPVGTLLLIGAVLLCPAAMFFGMRGMSMQQGCGHGGACRQAETHGAGREPERREQQLLQDKL